MLPEKPFPPHWLLAALEQAPGGIGAGAGAGIGSGMGVGGEGVGPCTALQKRLSQSPAEP